MSKIIPKLNLNRNAQVVENASLVFAKNIKLTKELSITADDGIEQIKLFNVIDDIPQVYDKDGNITTDSEFLQYYNNYKIVGIIPYNKEIYYFLYYNSDSETLESSRILRYFENSSNPELIECSWKYSGGSIDGNVTVNLNSHKILTIIEYFEDNSKEHLVPIKCINISKCNWTDDESIYSITPKIPITNLLFNSFYNETIPSGVYQFFIRYEIKTDFYTKWFPASKELFSGRRILENTSQGTVSYIDTKLDSDKSFVFTVQHINDINTFNYKYFQIGFIISNEDQVVARSWKKFSLDTSLIYFDYDKSYISEVDINTILEDVYGLYNVKNLTNFKNKQYISNYIETDYNPTINDEYISGINIELKNKDVDLSTKIYKLDTGEECLIGYTSDYTSFIHSINNTRISELLNITSNDDSILIDSNYLTVDGGDGYDKETDYSLNCFVNIGTYENSKKVRDNKFNEWNKIPRKNDTTREGYAVLRTIVNGYTTSQDVYGDDWNSSKYKEYGEWIMNVFPLPVENNNVYPWYHANLVEKEIQQRLLGVIIDSNKLLYNDHTKSEQTQINNFTVEYEIAYFKIVCEDITLGQLTYPAIKFTKKSYKGEITISSNLTIKTILSNNLVYSETLIPYKKYAFFIHYVKDTGEVTNGYKIKEIEIPNESYVKTVKQIYYPTFSNVKLPNGYKAYFITMADVGSKISQVFNIKPEYDGDDVTKIYADCIDIDVLLNLANSNIEVLTPEKNEEYPNNILMSDGVYITSGTSDRNNIEFFGASGKIVFDKKYENDESEGFIKIDRQINTDELKLIKITPYCNVEEYDNYDNLTLGNYVCSVYKPTTHELDIYLSGSDIYNKVIEENMINLTDYKENYGVYETKANVIYSEYNLAYLSLSETLSDKIRTFTTTTSTTTKEMIKVFESLTLSDIYMLPSMYKEYTRKLYEIIDSTKSDILIFNNTIRASDVLTDEGELYVYTFDSTKYYNVPTNKGLITSLKSIADKILVHTEDSLFSFTGSTKLSTENGDATQLSESDPFDTGITEIFGSDKGFAGLQNKNHSMITYEGYIFYDQDANVIYDYTGQGLIPISDVIEKIMNLETITDILFANDYYNNRFLTLIKTDNHNICLSFNYKSKTFVSIHDFKFDKSFSTKINCYFLKDNKVFKYNKDVVNYSDLENNDTYFPYKKGYAIADVIYNNNYETIKILNSISWIGKQINPNYELFSSTDLSTFNMVDSYIKDNIIDYLRIYSDNCMTDLTFINNKDSSNISIYDKDSANYPIYNNGIWTFNNFRDNLNSVDQYVKYDDIPESIKDKYTKDSEGYAINEKGKKVNNPKYYTESDNKLSIIGKYFVVRFIIDRSNKFRLDNIIFNTQQYV